MFGFHDQFGQASHIFSTIALIALLSAILFWLTGQFAFHRVIAKGTADPIAAHRSW
jgi:hypothetical protein